MLMDLNYWLMPLESIVRLVFFVLFFCIFGIWQHYQKDRFLPTAIKVRWGRHFTLLVSGLACVGGLCFSVVPLSVAFEVSQQKMGILNSTNLISLPYEIKMLLSILMLDWVVYMSHRAYHRIPLAWRFHKVHHTDREIDVTTGFRFHPIETLLSFLIKILAIIVIGPPLFAVLLFEILLNAAVLFTHTNVKIPEKIEGIMRYFIVTPTMHHIHHSDLDSEQHHNFGFIFSIWDKLFSSYLPDSKFEEQMNSGVKGYRDPQYQTLKVLFKMPFEAHRRQASIEPKIHMKAPT